MFKDMAGMLQKAQKMQEKVQQVQEALKKEEITGSSGAGLVHIVMNGAYEAKSIKIDDSLFDDKEMLEDLITAAINDANRKISEKSSNRMQDLTGGLLPADFKLPF